MIEKVAATTRTSSTGSGMPSYPFINAVKLFSLLANIVTRWTG
jgi:hypothetical protein